MLTNVMTLRMAIWTLPLAAVVLGGSTASAQDTVVYFHTDAVGSVRMVTNASGTVLDRYDYLPFGEDWPSPPTVQERRRFTGQERDAETGFDYFSARYLAANTGRFMSADDPSYSDPSEPQSLNLYVYTRNNPLAFVDPTGHQIICVSCEPGLDASQLRFELEAFKLRLSEATERIVTGITEWVSTPRNPACMNTFMIGGAAAGAAVGGGVGVLTGPGEVAIVPVGALTGAVRGGVVGLGACMSSANSGGGSGGSAPKPGGPAKPNPRDPTFRGLTVDQIKAKYLKGGTELPGGYGSKTFAEIERLARQGDRDAITLRKLLTQKEYWK